MKKTKYVNNYIVLQLIVVTIYLIGTLAMFFLAKSQGNEGITFKIFGGGDDGLFYWTEINKILEGYDWHRTSIYPLFIARLIRLTGYNSVFFIRIVNFLGFIFLLSSTVSLISLQFRYNRIDDNDAVVRSKTLMMLFFITYLSLFITLSYSIIRDVWIFAFFMFTVYLMCKVRFQKGNRIFNLILAGICVFILYNFRPYTAVTVILVEAAYLIFHFFDDRGKTRLFFVLAIGILALFYTFFINFELFNFSLRRALAYRELNMEGFSGGSQMWISLEKNNFISFLIAYIHSFLGNFIGPLPWHISGMNTLVIFVMESIPMIFLLRYLFKYRRYIDKMQKYMLLFAFGWAAIISFTNDNIGTASRLRPISWLIIFSVISVVAYKRRVMAKPKTKEVTVTDPTLSIA